MLNAFITLFTIETFKSCGLLSVSVALKKEYFTINHKTTKLSIVKNF